MRSPSLRAWRLGERMVLYDDSGNMVHDATCAYGYDPENRLVKVKKSGDLPALTLGQALYRKPGKPGTASNFWSAANRFPEGMNVRRAVCPCFGQFLRACFVSFGHDGCPIRTSPSLIRATRRRDRSWHHPRATRA